MKRYNHNRSNTRIQDFDMGKIVPTRASHCVAGTTLVGGVSAAIELAPMVHMALGTIRTDTFAIAAADRILWKDAEDFYTGGEDGNTRPTPPYIVAPADGGWPIGSLADYLGFPTGVPNLKCNALPFRLYAMWWNENVRDEQLQDALPVSMDSGLDIVTNTELRSMNWPKDMFTTARPEATLGDDVVIPLATSAPVVGKGNSRELFKFVDDGTPSKLTAYGSNVGNAQPSVLSSTKTDVVRDVESNMISDLTNATGILPDDFNFAMSRARWKSRRNLFGSAYKDVLAFLGIKYSDRRLQLPSTLAHGKNFVDVNGVLQTAPGSDSVVGQMAGRGTGYAGCKYKTYFEEWTTVIHLICVRPAPLYINMNNPEWQFEVREDVPTPEFMHVGMVEEKVGTLFSTGDATKDNVRFGFRNRYDEVRSGFNQVCGKFKTTNKSYHQGREFNNAPALNSDFIECLPSPRIFANLAGSHIEASAIRNTFIERNFVTPDGNPHYN